MKYLALIISLCPLAAQSQLEWPEWRIPERVKLCLATGSGVAGRTLTILTEVNPYYLRGDFDGDRTIDLAIAVRDAAENDGIIICSRTKGVSVLGSVYPRVPFGDVRGDRMLPVGWNVIGKAELRKLLRENNPKRHIGFITKLSMMSEEILYIPDSESMAIVYCVAGKYYWYTINSPLVVQVP